MIKQVLFSLVPLALAAIVVAQGTPESDASSKRKTAPAKTKAWKIQNAMSAAPVALAKDATIVDQPKQEGGDMAVLRKGTNEWTCIPDDPATPSNDPMCLDKNAMEWAKAWKAHTEPKLSSAGIGYMLQGGGSPSNTDPFATNPPSGKKWMKEPPHLMLFGVKLDSSVYSADPHSGGPWIMWSGTPYEHLMVPAK